MPLLALTLLTLHATKTTDCCRGFVLNLCMARPLPAFAFSRCSPVVHFDGFLSVRSRFVPGFSTTRPKLTPPLARLVGYFYSLPLGAHVLCLFFTMAGVPKTHATIWRNVFEVSATVNCNNDSLRHTGGLRAEYYGGLFMPPPRCSYSHSFSSTMLQRNRPYQNFLVYVVTIRYTILHCHYHCHFHCSCHFEMIALLPRLYV